MGNDSDSIPLPNYSPVQKPMRKPPHHLRPPSGKILNEQDMQQQLRFEEIEMDTRLTAQNERLSPYRKVLVRPRPMDEKKQNLATISEAPVPSRNNNNNTNY